MSYTINDMRTYSICLSNLDEFIDSFWIVRVFVRMFFSGKFSVCLLDLANGGFSVNTQKFMRNKLFQWFKMLHYFKALIGNEPQTSKKQKLECEPWSQEVKSIFSPSLRNFFLTYVAETILDRIVDLICSIKHRFNQGKIRCWREGNYKHCQAEVVEGGVIVVELFFLASTQIFSKS